jgi:DNA-directed RNA polymerase specialized sigma24 family protein
MNRLARAWTAVACVAFFAAAVVPAASSPEAALDSAWAHIEASRLEAASGWVDSALAEDPSHEEARLLRARILSWEGRFAQAESELNALLLENPENSDVWLAMGYLHYYQGLSLKATAEVSGVSTSTVKYRLRGALDRLRADVKQITAEQKE